VIRIVLNGEPHELSAPMSVEALLTSLGIDRRVVAVELDRLVVRRERYGETVINEGAEVEIVAFVGGGIRGWHRPSNRARGLKFQVDR
jgi:sulfur carrier protein